MTGRHLFLGSLLGLLLCTGFKGDDFYLVDNATDRLYRSNSANPSAAVEVAQLPSWSWGDLTPSDRLFHLFANRFDGLQIATIRESDGEIVDVLDADRILRSIAYDRASDTLWALPQAGTIELLVVDRVTGATTVVGQTGIPTTILNMVSLEFVPEDSLLYASVVGGGLYSIDPETASSSYVGNTGLAAAFGLAFNPRDRQLYATDEVTDSLYVVDRTDASVVLIGGPYAGATFATGLSFSNVHCQRSAGFQGPGTASMSICGGDFRTTNAGATLRIDGAQANARVVLLYGADSRPRPALGGTLVPFPAILYSGAVVVTDPSGHASLPFPTPPPNRTFYVQAILVGASIEISNAVEVET